MMRSLLCLVILSLLFTDLRAQHSDSTASKKFAYYLQLQTGPLIGCNDCSSDKEITYSVSIVQGVKIGKRLRMGGGVGHDSFFGWNVAPVFGSVSWDLFKKRNAFVLQYNQGVALKSWRYDPFNYTEYGLTESKAGRMINPMLGYRIHYGDLNVTFLAGFKQQRITSYFEYPSYYWTTDNRFVEGDPSTKTRVERLNRLTLALAIGWK